MDNGKPDTSTELGVGAEFPSDLLRSVAVTFDTPEPSKSKGNSAPTPNSDNRPVSQLHSRPKSDIRAFQPRSIPITVPINSELFAGTDPFGVS